MAVEHMRRWRVGEAEIIRIVEMYDFQDDVWVLLKDATAELPLSHDWLKPHFITPDGRLRMNFQAFLVISQGRRIMVDTCIGNGRKREYDVFSNLQTSFLEDIAAAGCPAESIDTVLCTHLHLDHCGWNTRLQGDRWVPTFPNARYLFDEGELRFWQRKRDAGEAHMEHVDDAIQPIVDAGLVDFITPGHQITDEIRLIPTPGHTLGHVSVHISSGGEDAVITGDVVHHPVQFAVPDWENNFDFDKDAGARQRRRFFGLYADQPALVIGSHFAEPGAGRIVTDGEVWRLKLDEA
jgi:glyoxylase-like metal-dependent hydrolase (beta-lactamase superfamily II)